MLSEDREGDGKAGTVHTNRAVVKGVTQREKEGENRDHWIAMAMRVALSIALMRQFTGILAEMS